MVRCFVASNLHPKPLDLLLKSLYYCVCAILPIFHIFIDEYGLHTEDSVVVVPWSFKKLYRIVCHGEAGMQNAYTLLWNWTENGQEITQLHNVYDALKTMIFSSCVGNDFMGLSDTNEANSSLYVCCELYLFFPFVLHRVFTM